MSTRVQSRPGAEKEVLRDLLPDPVLTANIYCRASLDLVVSNVLAPFFVALQEHRPRERSYLWFVRYGKGGLHLKVRVHGSEFLGHEARELLARTTQSFFSSLPELKENRIEPADSLSAGISAIPAIDIEDEVTRDYPDRSLLWTQYRRSHISLGSQPFLKDSIYAARLTECLGRACEEIVLAALEPGTQSELTHSRRQTALLKGLICGLSAADRSLSSSQGYLAFHRDWLVRFQLMGREDAEDRISEVLRRFDERTQKMPSQRQSLRQAFEGVGSIEVATSPDPWRESIGNLAQYTDQFRDDPAYLNDPFTTESLYPPLFKVFHGLANQLGLSMMDEAFSHHLLLKSVE